MSNKKKIKLNVPLRSHAAGTVLTIKVDKDGTPLERYWRDRLRDAKTDNCVELMSTKGAVKPSVTTASDSKGGDK